MSQKKSIEEKSIWQDARAMLAKAEKENIETVWDRLEKQIPSCKFCETGTSCRNCSMGPCRVNEDSDKLKLGVCGANADVIVARNFARFVTGGAASHSDHGRDLVQTLYETAQGNAPGYSIKDEAKLRSLAAEYGVENAESGSIQDVAKALADACFEDFGSRKEKIGLLSRVPQQRQELWDKLRMTPRGIDREISEAMHRTHMGCDNDPVSLIVHAARTTLADGWGGSMIGTELSDILFGTPKPVSSKVNLGVLKKDCINILVHGHNPVVSEMILGATREPDMIAKAKQAGAAGFNVAGLCCTGNELLMRQGIPLAGNHLMTELAIITGAVEAIVADYQCIMPSLVTVANCYHTRFITTSSKGRFTGATHIEVIPRNAQERCREIVDLAIEAYKSRDDSRVDIPVEPVEITSGFSNEAILAALGGSPDPLIDSLKSGQIQGIAAVIGCNNPKYQHDSVNVGLIKELIKRNILVLVTGCVTVSAGKAKLMMPQSRDMAGEGLKSVCAALGIPPVLHLGSCVDNSRILALCALIANSLGVDISDLPVAGAAPEWYSEKAAAIGVYCVASGIPVHLGHPPAITGSRLVTDIALNQLNSLVGAAFIIEPDPVKAADKIEEVIKNRRNKLGL